MSRSHEASRGACLESTELGSGGSSGSVSGGAQTGEEGGGHRAFRQVGVGSGVNW